MSVPAAPVTGSGHDPAVWRDLIASTPRLAVPDLRALVPDRDLLARAVSGPPDRPGDEVDPVVSEESLDVRLLPVGDLPTDDPDIVRMVALGLARGQESSAAS